MATVLPVGNEGAMNGVTPVTVISSPAASHQLVVPIGGINIHNRDTAAVTVTVKKVKGAGSFLLKQVTLDVGDTWTSDHQSVLDAANESITAELSAAAATTNPDFDASWVDRS